MSDEQTTAAEAASDAAEKERKKRYKQTLNLPRTSFPMKANLKQNEPQSQKRWAESGQYQRVLTARAGAEPYVFHDGPPYANGPIHTGHLLNKVLKDLVVRTRLMAGRHCPYVPGWDCHGLPIEHKVQTEMVASGKFEKLQGLDEGTRRMAVRRACAADAEKYIKLQASGMLRLSTLADYENPYKTLSPIYEQKTLEVFAEMLEQGIVYRDLKPVHWSIANETALAEAELEYYDREDPSIYVWFEVDDPAALASAFGVDASEVPGDSALMIWTTTPWTLPANLLIAVHERFDYVLVDLAGRVGVVAEKLLDPVAKGRDIEPGSVRILGRCKGADLLGLEYRHPFRDETAGGAAGAWKVVAAEYVTLEDGTGLVHTAPGHGAEDYATGQREGLPIYCPVQADGTYDDTVPEWLRGHSIWDANPQIIERLRASGHLYLHFDFHHSYPHDWRSKTPVVFRATEQWFVAVDRDMARGNGTLRGAALEATRGVEFVPGWGRKRLDGMLEARPDWCLSRQRAWGLPIPAFRLPSGEVLLTARTVRVIAERFAAHPAGDERTTGSDSWFLEDPEALLAGYDPGSDPDAPRALREGTVGLGELEKMYDIFDVWFESGASWNAVVRERGMRFPTDLYLEGSDQHRGWFQSSLLASIGATGEAPYRTLLTHGFIVDKDNRKMSKSLGNTLDVDDLLERFGADVCRWWVSSLAFENDIKVDLSFFELAGESYRKVRNTLRFLLSNLDDFDAAEHKLPLSRIDPCSIDAWALRETALLYRQVTDAYERFDFRRAHQALFDFCNHTLSSVYLDAVKDRLYCDLADAPRRRRTQSALHEITRVLASLLAPILPHTADEATRALLGDDVDVHVDGFAEPGSDLAADLESVLHHADPSWEAVIELHGQVDKALEEAKPQGIENTLDAGVRIGDSPGAFACFLADLPDLLSVSRVQLDPRLEDGEVVVVDLRDQPRCERSWKRDETVKLRQDGGWLSDRDAEAVGMA
ncbi:MAG: isoleucine--tRNA ligase [Acidobacteria bacterium]|nr:MAG: isoleucine--tRNA ligase [Acidobacteriota bacterium]REK08345.1 MAG: isoleucine--tRNA ligase [Acidobacteriota bacterium]